MKVLLVENNLPMRRTIKKILQTQIKEIQTIYECVDGAEAIDIYRAVQPDWVIMDLKLTKLDGLTATKEIIKMNPQAQVIILTQYDDPEYREAAALAGACGYVLKEHLHEIVEILR